MVFGKSFENIQILAKDSIFVFVETTTDITQQTGDLEFLYTDRILFDPTGIQQDVDLVTLVKDAVFLFPDRDEMTGEIETLPIEGIETPLEGFFLADDELIFTAEKPYVIYGYAAIPSGRTLTIEAGARIHFHSESGIIAANNSTLLVNGTLSTDPVAMENEVIFEGDRLEPGFSDIPGQWNGIWLTAGSTGHIINHATIKNAVQGIRMDANDGGTGPTLTITNTQIYNSSLFGLLALTGNISAENLVINSSGLSSVRLSLGGIYNFNHCTFTNYWTNSFRDSPSVFVENFLEIENDQALAADLTANFTNCIIYGNENLELTLRKVDGVAFNYNFKNSLIRFNDVNNTFEGDALYDFTNNSIFDSIILNEDPEFKAPFENMLNIDENSAANGQASTPTSGNDILGTPRDLTAPDIGAYESVSFDMQN